MKKLAVMCVLLALIASASAWGASSTVDPGTTPQQAPNVNKPAGQPGPGPKMNPPMFRRSAPSVVTAASLPPAPLLLNPGGPLEITQDQVTKLQPVMSKAEETLIKLSEKTAGLTQALREAIVGQGDATQIPKLLANIQSAEMDMAKAEIDAWAQIKTILTADQMKKLGDFVKNMPPMPNFPGFAPPGPAEHVMH